MALPHSLPSLPSASVLSFPFFLCVAVELTDRVGGGGEPNQTITRKVGKERVRKDKRGKENKGLVSSLAYVPVGKDAYR